MRPDPALTPAKSAPIPAIGLLGCILLSEGCCKGGRGRGRGLGPWLVGLLDCLASGAGSGGVLGLLVRVSSNPPSPVPFSRRHNSVKCVCLFASA